jgi:hypothetical protein
MRACVENGAEAVNWEREASTHPMNVMQVARSLSVAGAHTACAERGLRALLMNVAMQESHWGVYQVLLGIALSQGRYDQVVSLTDSAVAGGHGRAPAFYFIGVLVGAPLEAKAEETDSLWRRLYGEQYGDVSLETRWLVAAWCAHRRDTVRLRALRAAMLADTQGTALPIRAVLDGHLALARGDTITALRHFRVLRLDAPRDAVEWSLVESLAIERLLLARLAIARGDYAEAHRVAGVFDHPAPVAYLSFMRPALDVRLRSARALGKSDLVGRYRARMNRLKLAEVTALGL